MTLLLYFIIMLTSAQQCFTDTELSTLSIKPANRDGAKFDLVIGNWDSSTIMTKAASIMLNELMGYSINEIVVGGSGQFFAHIANSTTFAFGPECWDYGTTTKTEYAYVARNISILGSPGFSGVETMFFTIPPAIEDAFSYSPITVSEIQAYIGDLNPGTRALAAVMDAEQFIRSNATARDAIAKAAGMEGSSIDELAVPGHIFDPWNCYGTDRCFEMMMPTTGWSVNTFQAIVKNLKIPTYITWWNDTNGYSRYWPTVKERINAQLPTYFYWWQPDGKLAAIGTVEEDYFPLLFKGATKKCFSGIRTDNLVGDSTRDCLVSTTPVMKLFTGKDVAPVYEDASEFAISYVLQLDTINDMLAGLTQVAADSSDPHREAACAWLKANPEKWKELVSNTFSLPEHAEELSLEIVAFTIFGVVCGLVLLIYLVNYFELVKIMEAKLLNSGIRVALGQLWDFLEIGCIVGAYVYEISGVPGISAWVQFAYVCVIGLNVVGCLYAGWMRYDIVNRTFSGHNTNFLGPAQAIHEKMGEQSMIPPLKEVHDEVVELYDFSEVEMYSLIMFELPQVIMGFYMIATYNLTETIFLVSLCISTTTMGMMLDVVGTRLTYMKILNCTDQLFHNDATSRRQFLSSSRTPTSQENDEAQADAAQADAAQADAAQDDAAKAQNQK